MKDKWHHSRDNKQLKNCKLEKYKIDNKLKKLYKVTTIYQELVFKVLKPLPVENLDNSVTNFFFTLMNNYQCDNFAMYYDYDYDIKKIINLNTNQELVFTLEQFKSLQRFFIDIKDAIVILFDHNIKPIINSPTGTFTDGRTITNSLEGKKRILN